MYQQNNSSESKAKFRQASNHCKRVLEAAKLAYTTKTKGLLEISNSVLNKDKSAIPPLFNRQKALISASDKSKLFTKYFCNKSDLDDSGIFSPILPSRTNFDLNNTFITPKMVKKVMTNLDSSKASGPKCLPVVVLKNCESEFSYILAEFFNICLKESFFPDFWKVSLVFPVFKNVEVGCTAKAYKPVSLLFVVS